MKTSLWKRKLLNNPTSLGFQVAVFRGSFPNVTCGKIPLWESLFYWQFLPPFPGSFRLWPELGGLIRDLFKSEKHEKWPPFGWSKSHLKEAPFVGNLKIPERSFVWFEFSKAKILVSSNLDLASNNQSGFTTNCMIRMRLVVEPILWQIWATKKELLLSIILAG